jgi:hypothetical protein
MLGAKVYEKPTFESKTLTALSIGECIIAALVYIEQVRCN